MPGFSAVIPTRGRPDFLRETLDSLLACDPPPEEVIVVDGDDERSAEAVVATAAAKSPATRFTYLTSEPRLTRQRNVGIDASSEAVVAFFDDDVEIRSNTFAVLAEAYHDPAVVGATGRVVEPAGGRFGGKESRARRLLLSGGREGSFTRAGYPRYILHVDRPMDVEVMPGCFMTARREAAAQLRFDENLPGYAVAEDEDFSYRLSRLGRIRYMPQAVVRHKKLGFASRDPRMFGHLVATNRTYLFRKNFPQTRLAKIQFALLSMLVLGRRVVNRDWAGARGFAEGTWRAWRARA